MDSLNFELTFNSSGIISFASSLSFYLLCSWYHVRRTIHKHNGAERRFQVRGICACEIDLSILGIRMCLTEISHRICIHFLRVALWTCASHRIGQVDHNLRSGMHFHSAVHTRLKTTDNVSRFSAFPFL